MPLKPGVGRMAGAIPPTPVVCPRAGDSTPTALLRTQPGNEGEKQVLIGIVAGKQEANPAGIAEDDSTDLEQLQPEGIDIGGRQRCTPQPEPLQRRD